LPALTALRFPAAAAIVALHYLPQADLSPPLVGELATAVSFFYVLSGFILYYSYFDLQDRGAFWTARLARIWPVHFVTFLIIVWLLPFHDLLGHAHWPITLPANLLLIQAWLPFHGSALSYNGVAWSLSVEMFFYLCFPWLLFSMKKSGIGFLLTGSFLLGLGLVKAAALWLPNEPNFGAFNPPSRLFEFILGMSACHLRLKQSRSTGSRKGWSIYEASIVLAALLLVLAIRPILYHLANSSPLTEWFATVVSALGFAGVIWVFAHQAGAISAFISLPFFVRLGEISFALYMCHQIVVRWLDRPPSEIRILHPELFLISYLLLSMAFSCFLYYFVETPARHFIVGLYKKRRQPVVPASPQP
jgi:peptidoglycan/LPS O-acetylase OafA/YrhL